MCCKPRRSCGMSSRDLGSRKIAPMSTPSSINWGLIALRIRFSSNKDLGQSATEASTTRAAMFVNTAPSRRSDEKSQSLITVAVRTRALRRSTGCTRAPRRGRAGNKRRRTRCVDDASPPPPHTLAAPRPDRARRPRRRRRGGSLVRAWRGGARRGDRDHARQGRVDARRRAQEYVLPSSIATSYNFARDASPPWRQTEER